jgi:HD-like signal output (HDOD) protein
MNPNHDGSAGNSQAGQGRATASVSTVDEAVGVSLRELSIPPCPVILDQIAHEMRRADPDFRKLAGLICADVGLSAGLIKTVNSPFFGLRVRAKTVTQALAMLGLDVSARAIAGLILQKVFGDVPNMERFWDSSAAIARLAGWLVSQIGVRDQVRADDAYTFGLFRDCGMPVLMRKFPTYHATLAEANADAERRFTLIEETRFPTNHAIVGCLLAQSWWLPEETCLAIRHHHDYVAMQAGSAGLPPASRRLIAIAQCAEFVHQQISGQCLTREWDKMGGACLLVLGVEPEGLEALITTAREEVYSAPDAAD